MITKSEGQIRARKVCEMRLEGYTIDEIAKELETTKQYVFHTLKRLHVGVDVGNVSFGQTVDKERAMRLAGLLIHKVGFEDAIKTIGMDRAEGVSILNLICASNPPKRMDTHKYFPKVAEWLTTNNVTTIELAKRCDVSYSTLRTYLQGRNYMPLELAKSISKVTGISLLDIYSETVYDAWMHDYNVGGKVRDRISTNKKLKQMVDEMFGDEDEEDEEE